MPTCMCCSGPVKGGYRVCGVWWGGGEGGGFGILNFCVWYVPILDFTALLRQHGQQQQHTWQH
jgi:hypothetical protein